MSTFTLCDQIFNAEGLSVRFCSPTIQQAGASAAGLSGHRDPGRRSPYLLLGCVSIWASVHRLFEPASSDVLRPPTLHSPHLRAVHPTAVSIENGSGALPAIGGQRTARSQHLSRPQPLGWGAKGACSSFLEAAARPAGAAAAARATAAATAAASRSERRRLVLGGRTCGYFCSCP